jgi:hypothetical protein
VLAGLVRVVDAVVIIMLRGRERRKVAGRIVIGLQALERRSLHTGLFIVNWDNEKEHRYCTSDKMTVH